MKVKHIIPGLPISEYVQGILVLETSRQAVPFSLPLFANGSPTLVFTTVKAKTKNTFTHLTLFGQTVVPDAMQVTETCTIIAYFLFPHSLPELFGLSARELTDSPVDLHLAPAPPVAELQEKLLNSHSLEEQIRFLDSYILKLVSKGRHDFERIKYAAGRIALNSSNGILGSVQRELCMTERTFRRMFERDIGVSPNLFRRICQFNKAFQQLNYRKFEKLTDIAFHNDYADQSHYIRSFREFTGITPRDYLNLGKPPEAK